MSSSEHSIASFVVSLKRYAMALSGDVSQADDLVQETMTRALSRARRNGGLKDIENLRAYLFTVMHNAFVDTLGDAEIARNSVQIEDAASSLATRPAQNDAMDMYDLEKALNKLPAQYREVLLLIGLEGFSYREAAEALDVPVGTIMSRLSRAREQLSRHMERPDMKLLVGAK